MDRRNNQSVIIKTCTHETPDEKQDDRLRHEYQILKKLALNTNGIVEVLSFETSSRRPFLILKDIGGLSLSQWMDQSGLPSLDNFFEISSLIAKALEALH